MLRFALVATLVALASARHQPQVLDSALDDHWMSFKDHHGKNYGNSMEQMERRVIWEDNLKYIRAHNLEYDLGKHSYWLGMNEYSDFSHKEFVAMMNGARVPQNHSQENMELFMAPENYQLPSSVDWRRQGYVTGVKNQGGCGSCWAFSTTGALEGQWKRKSGRLPNLSEQQLVDCASRYGCHGCRGGWPSSAFKYIAAQGGIDSEGSYGYTGRDGSCHFQRGSVAARDTGSVGVRSGSENDLAAAVASNGPVSVCVDASHRSFGHYRGGIYNEPACTTQIDHAVLAVGYGPGYWIVKNSWGASWGSGGYINMSRGRNNQCGIASYAAYPRV